MTILTLLTSLQKDLKTKNDAHLAQKLGTEQATICRLRKREDPLSPNFIIRCYDYAGYSVEKTRELFNRKD